MLFLATPEFLSENSVDLIICPVVLGSPAVCAGLVEELGAACFLAHFLFVFFQNFFYSVGELDVVIFPAGIEINGKASIPSLAS